MAQNTPAAPKTSLKAVPLFSALEDVDIPDGAVKKRFQGHLDDIRIFGRALSAAEVRALYRE